MICLSLTFETESYSVQTSHVKHDLENISRGHVQNIPRMYSKITDDGQTSTNPTSCYFCGVSRNSCSLPRSEMKSALNST